MARRTHPPPRHKESLGERLRKARKREGLSQSTLAQRLGVTQPTIGNWESAKRVPANFKKAVSKIEEILGPIDSRIHVESGQAPPYSSGFGKWVAEQRILKNMSVPDLARMADLTAAAIYNIEAGKSRNPQVYTRNKLASALGVTVPQEIVKDVETEDTIVGLGILTSFDPHSKLSDLPNLPGIYVLYDVSERPVYVGRSSDIAQRLSASHREKFWYKAPIVTNGSFIEVKDATLRRQLEQILIKFLKSNVVINKQSAESFEDD